MSGGWNRGVPLYTEVSSLKGVVYTEVSSFQGVGIEEFLLYTEVSSFQVVGIEWFHCIHQIPEEITCDLFNYRPYQQCY